MDRRRRISNRIRRAGAIYSSAHDLVRFGMFHLQTPLPDQQAIPVQSQSGPDARPSARIDDTSSYGLGFFVRERQGHRIVMHSGGSPSVTTNLTMFPDRKLAVVVLCNQSAKLPTRVLDRVIAKFVPGVAYQDSFGWPAPGEPRIAFEVPQSLAGQWQGTLATYAGDQPVTLNFTSSGEVHARVGNSRLRSSTIELRQRGVRRAAGRAGGNARHRSLRVHRFVVVATSRRGARRRRYGERHAWPLTTAQFAVPLAPTAACGRY